MRAFQFFNLNNEEDRQEFLTLGSNFLDKLIGGDTRGMANGMGNGKLFGILGNTFGLLDNIFNGNSMANGMANNNLFGILGNTFGLLDNIFGSRALLPIQYNFDQSDPQMMKREIEIETILDYFPEFILQQIADLAADNELFGDAFVLLGDAFILLGDACEFFQNLDN